MYVWINRGVWGLVPRKFLRIRLSEIEYESDFITIKLSTKYFSDCYIRVTVLEVSRYFIDNVAMAPLGPRVNSSVAPTLLAALMLCTG